jgi:hypothetical protein
MKLNPDTLAAYKQGLHVTGKQLEELYHFYVDLVESLDSLGESYYLAYHVTMMDFNMIYKMMEHRGWDTTNVFPFRKKES